MASADSDSSQVHPHELTGYFLSGDDVRYEPSAYERIRHSAWNHKRSIVHDVLIKSGATEKSMDRFIQCGCCCQIGYSPEQRKLFLMSSNCRNRFCDPCANARRNTIGRNLARFAAQKHLRLITLTIAHHERPLPDLISRINTCFKLMRKEKSWKQNVVGFASFIEVKWSERTRWFHVHLHILCEGSWWDSKDLSATWHKVTGDSYITDIREVTSEEGIRYAAKYASKPFNICDLPAEHRITAVKSLHHRRLWLVGGSWRAHAKLIATEPLPPDLTSVGSFNEVVRRSHQGDVEAQEIIQAILGDNVIELQRDDDTSWLDDS